MWLFVMRHGDAFHQAESDAERPLSPLGITQVKQMVDCFADQQSLRILTSPYRRARETTDVVWQSCQQRGIPAEVTVLDQLVPNADPMLLLNYLAKQPASDMLLVSHQPLVGMLTMLLTQGYTQGGMPVTTASVACIETDAPAAGLGKLLWYRQPV